MVPVPTMAMRCTVFGEFMTGTPLLQMVSAPAPDGCALLGECDSAFVRVFGVQQAVGGLVLALECLGVTEALGVSHDLFDLGERERSVDGDALGQLVCPGQRASGHGQLA